MSLKTLLTDIENIESEIKNELEKVMFKLHFLLIHTVGC